MSAAAFAGRGRDFDGVFRQSVHHDILRAMPVEARSTHPLSAASAKGTALLERRFDLPDEAATLAFGARFAQATRSARCVKHEHNERFAGLQVQLSRRPRRGQNHARARDIARARSRRPRAQPDLHARRTLLARHGDGSDSTLYHFDLYRFADPAEWADAGFREYFDRGAICLVEWPQRAGGLLGVPDLVFALEHRGTKAAF